VPSLDEVAAQVKFLLSKGDGARKCHFGLVDVEAKERIANPKGRVRFIKEMGSPEEYSEWNSEFDRYTEAVGNPVIARSIMLRCLRQLSDEMIASLAEDQ
jgi:hypothetical protein